MSRRNVGKALEKADADLDRAERKMIRAIRAWERARHRVRYLEKRVEEIQIDLDSLDALNGKEAE